MDTAMDYPAVSCCMPTYGRPVEILNESVKSFLDQDYPGEKELIIYNDNGLVEFACGHRQVRVVNSANREPTLGDKYNKTIAQANHGIVLIWDDDDICLPGRISYSIRHMIDQVFLASRNFILYGHTGQLDVLDRPFPATLCINKELFFRLGGYAAQDKGADLNIALQAGKITAAAGRMADEDIFYIYNWHPQTRYHHSAVTRNHSDEKARELIDSKIPAELKGKFNIEPRYYRDYRKLIDEHFAAKHI